MVDTQQRYEYSVVKLGKKHQEQQLNAQSALGWILVSVDGGKAYFKRSIGLYKWPH